MVPYVPGDLTDKKYLDDRYQTLAHYRYNQDQIRDDVAQLNGYPRTREDFTRYINIEPEDSKQLTEDFYQKHQEMLSQEYQGHQCHSCRKDKRLLSPILAAIRNFDMAKKLHKENLEHQPLPDTVTDRMYRKLQMQGHREPGLALKEGNYTSGVAWKTHAGYGPTRCTKLKVFRPKTSICNKIKDSANDRPSSVSSFDRKWRFIRQKKVTPIQLAVCWDLTPVNPKDEPKKTPHIDGSNGSLAPAVFSLVQSPKDGNFQQLNDPLYEGEPKCGGLHDYNVYNRRPNSRIGSSKGSAKSNDNLQEIKRAQSAQLNVDNVVVKSQLNSPNPNPVFTTLHPASPVPTPPHKVGYCSTECHQKNKKSEHKRLCVACELKNIKIKDTRPKSEYKMAFKAGVPKKVFTNNYYLVTMSKNRNLYRYLSEF